MEENNKINDEIKNVELTENELKFLELIKYNDYNSIKEILNIHSSIIKIWEYRTKEKDDSTILHFSILHNNTKIITRIINYTKNFLSKEELKIFINKKNKLGIVPIHLASYKGNIKIIDLLISNGSDIYVLSEKLLNVIHYSCQGNKPNSLLYYDLRYNFDYNILDKRNSTPLHWACFSSAYECVNFLMEKNVNLNSQDIEGNTPLHLAVSSGVSKIVRLLLQKGALVDIKNKSGFTPLQLAFKEKRIEIYNILKSNKKWVICNIKAPAKRIQKSKKYVIIIIIYKIITSYVNIGLIYSFIFVFYDKKNLNISIFFIHLIINIILVILFFFLICFNPGFVEKYEEIHDLDNLLIKKENSFLDFCFKCSIFKSDTIKHCVICNKCCKGFDHHCLWLDNCIGKNNYIFFILILYILFVDILTSIIISIVGLSIFYTSNLNLVNIYKINSFDSFYDFIKYCLNKINFIPNYNYTNIVLIIFLCINALIIFPLMFLLVMHTNNCKRKKNISNFELSQTDLQSVDNSALFDTNNDDDETSLT